MAREYKHIEQVTLAGMDHSVPPTQATWRELTGIRHYRGGYRKRPGIVAIGPTANAGAGTGVGKILVEHKHANPLLTEYLTPDADGNYDGEWDTSPAGPLAFGRVDNYPDIDRATSIDSAQTDGAKQSFTFDDLASVGVVARVTVYANVGHYTGGAHVLKCYIRRAATDTHIKTWEISGGASTYSRSMAKDPITSTTWTTTNVDALELVFEYVEGSGLQDVIVYEIWVKVEGISSGREVSKLYVGSGGFSRLDEDLAGFTDINGGTTTPTVDDAIMWDDTAFDGLHWFTNGKDDLYYYPDGSDEMDEIAAKPAGRCIASYANRLFLGDVTESATRSKERIRWCKLGDGTDWTTGAGNIELDETPGSVVALNVLTEVAASTAIGVLACYKERGIYHLQATGDTIDQYDKRLMNEAVGSLAVRSHQSYVNEQGRAVHAFLGTENGRVNVFEWDGSTATPVGDPIRDDIVDEVAKSDLRYGISTFDLEGGHYLLALPSAGSFPDKCWAYHVRTKAWSTWPMPGEVTAFGLFTLDGVATNVLSRGNQLGDKFNQDAAADDTTTAIPQEFITGDIELVQPFERGTLYRVWLWYVDHGAADFVVSVSVDGSDTWDDTDTVSSAGDDDGVVKLVRANVIAEGWKHCIKLACSTVDQELDLVSMTLEFERKGVV